MGEYSIVNAGVSIGGSKNGTQGNKENVKFDSHSLSSMKTSLFVRPILSLCICQQPGNKEVNQKTYVNHWCVPGALSPGLAFTSYVKIKACFRNVMLSLS